MERHKCRRAGCKCEFVAGFTVQNNPQVLFVHYGSSVFTPADGSAGEGRFDTEAGALWADIDRLKDMT
jgi:hypothetical protein